jgi:hypothetical protein
MLPRTELRYSEVQMRIFGRGVPGGPHVGDKIAALDGLAFLKARRVLPQVSIVVAVGVGWIKLVDGNAAANAEEKLFDAAVIHGHNRGSGRRWDVDGLMPAASGSRLVKGILQSTWIHAGNR